MKIIWLGLLGLFLALTPFTLRSQCALAPVSIEDRIENSDLVIEGQVLNQSCFVDEFDGHIYTSNKLEIIKIFKGNPSSKEVYLITKGGKMGNKAEHLEPALSLKANNKGIFFLYEGHQLLNSSESTYRPYSGPQACLFYDETKATASDVFHHYGSVNSEFYSIIEDFTGENYNEIHDLDLGMTSNKSSAPDIQSVSPLNVRAGTRDVIEIRGSGFGFSQGNGKVEFKNASTGSANIEPAATEYISWADDLIVLEVPFRAGTGTVRVIQSGSDIFPGLVVRFAHLAIATAQYPIPTLHLDNNGNGGFVWRMAPDFFNNNDAKASIERALDSWSDQTCINWENGASTTTDQDKQDQINNIRFADPGELEQGVLAITRNYWGNCDSAIAYTVEIDLSFDPDRDWNFDAGFPSFNEYDLESIAVHELGHAHQLGHVVDVSDFMHATIGQGSTKRNLSDNNIEGGFHVMKLSVVKKPCGPKEMTGKAACNIPLTINNIEKSNLEISIYPNPISNTLNVKTNTSHNDISIYDLSGALIHSDYFENTCYSWTIPSQISNGMYLVNVGSPEIIETIKVIIDR